MAIYLKLDPIKGSVTDSKFKDQIELTSFSWSAGLGVGGARGGDRTTSEPHVSEIHATKQLDKSSELLFKNLLMGETLAKGTISFTAAIKGESVAYAVLELEDVIVAGYSQSADGSALPAESLTLNFAKFVSTFSGRDGKQVSKPVRLTYDLAENKVG
jgi:type VI secretion system secreted protein Hcp